MLPDGLAGPVGLAYLVMRIVDTLEDDTHLADGERRAALADLERALAGGCEAAARLGRLRGDTPAEAALLRDAPEVFARLAALPELQRAAIAHCARAMSAGVLHLLDRSVARGRPYPAVENVAELREYCYYVAGVVGEMLCTLMADWLRRPALLALRPLAVELGTGLQLVNILKDAPADARHGRRYLPGAPEVAESRAYRVAALAEARTCLARGVDYVLALPAEPAGLRMFCGLPMVWGALTLRRAADEPSAAKIDRATIHTTIADFERRVRDDAALRDWFADLLGA